MAPVVSLRTHCLVGCPEGCTKHVSAVSLRWQISDEEFLTCTTYYYLEPKIMYVVFQRVIDPLDPMEPRIIDPMSYNVHLDYDLSYEQMVMFADEFKQKCYRLT